jgi:hypothetical protein
MDHVYYNFNIINDTNGEIIAEKTETRMSPILTKPNDFGMSILKFQLPTESIKSFVVNNSNDYQIKYGSSATVGFFDETTFMNPYSGSSSLPLSNSYNYINNSDVIEAFNRTSFQAYRNYLYDYGKTNIIVPIYSSNIVSSGSYSFTVSQPNLFVHEQTINISAGGSSATVDGRLGYLKLILNIGSPDSNVRPHRVYLISPTGVKCLIYAGFTTLSSNTLSFEDGNIQGLDSQTDYTLPLASGNYLPKESFLKFITNTSQLGNWKLRIESSNWETMVLNFSLNVSYTIDAYFLPKQGSQGNSNDLGIVQFPILLGLDENQPDLLQLKIHESFLYGNNYFALTPKLNNILGYPSYNGGDGFYKLKIPQVLLSNPMTSNSFFNYNQPSSTLYKLTNIKSIQIRSNSLPVSGEYSIASQTQIVMSINVNTDTKKDIFEFSASIERVYDLIGDTPIADLNFSIFIEYNDGSVVPAILGPYSKFSMLVKFIAKQLVSN